MKILTGIAILTDAMGKRIAYSYNDVDTNGTVIDSNKRESFVVVDEDLKHLIESIEVKISSRL